MLRSRSNTLVNASFANLKDLIISRITNQSTETIRSGQFKRPQGLFHQDVCQDKKKSSFSMILSIKLDQETKSKLLEFSLTSLIMEPTSSTDSQFSQLLLKPTMWGDSETSKSLNLPTRISIRSKSSVENQESPRKSLIPLLQVSTGITSSRKVLPLLCLVVSQKILVESIKSEETSICSFWETQELRSLNSWSMWSKSSQELCTRLVREQVPWVLLLVFTETQYPKSGSLRLEPSY